MKLSVRVELHRPTGNFRAGVCYVSPYFPVLFVLSLGGIYEYKQLLVSFRLFAFLRSLQYECKTSGMELM